MSAENGRPRGKAHAKVAPTPRVGGISPETTAYLDRRSLAFAEATSKTPGKRNTYGATKGS